MESPPPHSNMEGRNFISLRNTAKGIQPSLTPILLLSCHCLTNLPSDLNEAPASIEWCAIEGLNL